MDREEEMEDIPQQRLLSRFLPLGSFRPPLQRRLGFYSKGHVLGIIVSPPTH